MPPPTPPQRPETRLWTSTPPPIPWHLDDWPVQSNRSPSPEERSGGGRKEAEPLCTVRSAGTRGRWAGALGGGHQRWWLGGWGRGVQQRQKRIFGGLRASCLGPNVTFLWASGHPSWPLFRTKAVRMGGGKIPSSCSQDRTLTDTLHPPSATLQPPSVTLQPPSAALQPPSVTLQPPSAALQPPSVTLQSPSVALQPPSVTLQPPSVALQPPSVTP